MAWARRVLGQFGSIRICGMTLVFRTVATGLELANLATRRLVGIPGARPSHPVAERTRTCRNLRAGSWNQAFCARPLHGRTELRRAHAQRSWGRGLSQADGMHLPRGNRGVRRNADGFVMALAVRPGSQKDRHWERKTKTNAGKQRLLVTIARYNLPARMPPKTDR
jgi:hypothetical protein